MAFQVEFPTRHTDTFADTEFVHAGVLLALTELAYQAFEQHCDVSRLKPAHVLAVQRATEAIYRSPLRWQEGVRIAVTTRAVSARGFDLDFELTSAADTRRIATFTHHWTWFDTQAAKAVPLPPEVQTAFREAGA